MAAICHGIGAQEAHDIAESAGDLLGAVESVLGAVSWIDSPGGASAKRVADAADRVEENYQNLTRIYGGWQDEEWTKAATAGAVKTFDLGGSFGMTAIQAAMAAGVVVLNAAAVHLRDGDESSPADVARFVAEVREGLAGVTPQEIGGHLRREYVVVEGTAETGEKKDITGDQNGLKPNDGDAYENAHDAYGQKLFPIDGKPSIDVRDAIVKLQTCRDGIKADMDILREFTGETKDNCPKAKLLPAKIRAARDRGETTLPPAR